MIFVTVGTHEQQFNRLIEEVDRLKGEGVIEDEVIMQTGFSTYEPKYCKWSKLIPYQELQKNIEEARIVITHGGPASFIAPLQFGKIPIVVPRQKEYDEHVNNHQVEFCKQVENRFGNIKVVLEIDELNKQLLNCELQKVNINKVDGNGDFCKKFENIVNDVMKDSDLEGECHK